MFIITPELMSSLMNWTAAGRGGAGVGGGGEKGERNTNKCNGDDDTEPERG